MNFSSVPAILKDREKVILAIIAVAIQVQVSLLAKGDYLGIRVNLCDFVLVLLCPYILYSLVRGRSSWPQWMLYRGWLWFPALALVMSIALVQGYFTNGFWSSWAVFNKYIGFYILLAYMFVGGWVITNTRDYSAMLRFFANVFCGFFVLLLCGTVLVLFVQIPLGVLLISPAYPWEGLMANRNAYMVIAVFVMLCVLLSYLRDDIRLSNWICALFWFLLPMFFYQNASRTGWIIFILFGVVFFLMRPKLSMQKIALPLVMGVVIVLLAVYGAGIRSQQGLSQYNHFFSLIAPPEDQEMYIGDFKRFIAIEDGMELYHSANNPILGAGLGSYKPFQIEKRGEFIDVIDFTALWLLVETGVLGLCAFAAFFFASLYGLFTRIRSPEPHSFHTVCFIFLLCFAAMTLLHELLYMRFLWLIVGMAVVKIAVAPRERGSISG